MLRAQLELNQVRQEIDRRIAEKEEEFENSRSVVIFCPSAMFDTVVHRKNHARAMDSIQASLDSEQRAKAEALRVKKKLEGDINSISVYFVPKAYKHWSCL